MDSNTKIHEHPVIQEAIRSFGWKEAAIMHQSDSGEEPQPTYSLNSAFDHTGKGLTRPDTVLLSPVAQKLWGGFHLSASTEVKQHRQLHVHLNVEAFGQVIRTLKTPKPFPLKNAIFMSKEDRDALAASCLQPYRHLIADAEPPLTERAWDCLLYTSDAADE